MYLHSATSSFIVLFTVKLQPPVCVEGQEAVNYRVDRVQFRSPQLSGELSVTAALNSIQMPNRHTRL